MDSEDSELSYGFSLDHNCARCGSYFKKKCKDDKLKFSCGHAYHYECVKENDHCYANGCEMLYMPWDETFPLELQAFVFNKERKDLNANIRALEEDVAELKAQNRKVSQTMLKKDRMILDQGRQIRTLRSQLELIEDRTNTGIQNIRSFETEVREAYNRFCNAMGTRSLNQ